MEYPTHLRWHAIQYGAVRLGRAQTDVKYESMARLYNYLPYNVSEAYALAQLDVATSPDTVSSPSHHQLSQHLAARRNPDRDLDYLAA